MNERNRTFDAEKCVTNYRTSIAQRDASRTLKWREEFNKIALQLRQQWKDWQGEDSLHEMAFGEPEE